MLLNGAANRDPRRFECPAEFRVDRPNAHGPHRVRARCATRVRAARSRAPRAAISIERILERMHDIRLSEEHHGPGRRPPLRRTSPPGCCAV